MPHWHDHGCQVYCCGPPQNGHRGNTGSIKERRWENKPRAPMFKELSRSQTVTISLYWPSAQQLKLHLFKPDLPSHPPDIHHSITLFTRSSSYLSLSRSPDSSCIKFCNHSLVFAAWVLWNELPKYLWQFLIHVVDLLIWPLIFLFPCTKVRKSNTCGYPILS